jgi:hypothetical protein
LLRVYRDKKVVGVNLYAFFRAPSDGNTWKKTPAIELPKLSIGEAAFAASNTNIIVKGIIPGLFLVV